MAWTNAALVTAYNALGAQTSLITACETLNAQTATIAVDVPTSAVAAVLALSGSMTTLLNWSASPPAGAAVEAVQAAGLLVFTFEHDTLLPTFQMSNSSIAGKMGTYLAALVSASVITAADQTAILALATQVVPAWQPPVTPLALWQALGQPATISDLTWAVT